MSLDAPLPGEKVSATEVAPITVEAEGEAFMAAMAQMQGDA